MKLTEVFAKPKGKVKWTSKSSTKWEGTFAVEDRVFEFRATLGKADESMIYPVKLSKEELEDVWELQFVQKWPDYSLEITGGGKPIEVLNKALVAAKEFVKRAKPAYINFSAKEPSRMKLYNIMVKKLSSSMGFKVLNASQGNYLLQSKRHS